MKALPLSSDRPARSRDRARPAAERPSGRRGRGADEDPRRPPEDLGAGAWTGRMNPNRASPDRNLMSSPDPKNRDADPCAHASGETRPGCTQTCRDSPCAPTNAGR
jgi:hypothetical protein